MRNVLVPIAGALFLTASFTTGLLMGRTQGQQTALKPATTSNLVAIVDDQALCTTDADCAEWERKNGIPEKDRSYGAPVPATADRPAYNKTAVRCTATTKAGAQCKRTTRTGDKCSTHRPKA